jgi:hypothetical protein
LLQPPPELGGKVRRKSRDHKNRWPEIAPFEGVRLKHDLPGFALPQAEQELKN